jgi:hypothetical protein
MPRLYSVKISWWNVENIYSKKVPKLDDDDFLSLISKNDMIGLSEKIFQCLATQPWKKNKKAKTYSGRLAVLVKNNIRKDCRSVANDSDHILWI